MSGYQIEDNLMVEMLDVSRGNPPRHDFWTRSRKPSPSYNWFTMATAIGAHMGDESAYSKLVDVWSEPNDLWCQEPYPDGAHCTFTVLGLYLLRRASFKHGKMFHYNRANDEILQFWSVYLMNSTNPLDPGKNRSCWPGARAAGPATGRGLLDYLYLIGNGWTEDKIKRYAVEGKSLVNQAHRVFKNQEDFTMYEWAQIYHSEIMSDILKVTTPLRNYGFIGLKEFFKIGTRATFDFLRLEDMTFYSVFEWNCGIDGPRWVSIGSSDGKVPTQFPTEKVPRGQHEDGSAKISLYDRLVTAQGEHSGTFSHPITNAKIAFQVRLSPSGVYTTPVVVPPPITPPPPIIPPPTRNSWWEKFLDWLGL